MRSRAELQAWVFGHVQLTPKEAEELKGIPTMYHNQLVSAVPLACADCRDSTWSRNRAPG